MSCVDAWLDSLPCDIIQTDIQTDIQKDLRHITPPESVEQPQFRKRKRSQTFNAIGSMSPKKRKRDGMVGSEVESQPSASVEPPVSFSTESRQTTSSSPKRSKSPARDVVTLLHPSYRLSTTRNQSSSVAKRDCVTNTPDKRIWTACHSYRAEGSYCNMVQIKVSGADWHLFRL